MKKNIAIMCQNTIFQKAIAYSLSLKLEMIFHDINAVMEYENTDLEDLIQLNGLEYYDKIERKTIKEVSKFENAVISTDRYGIFASENLDVLKENAVLVFLNMNKMTLDKLDGIYGEKNDGEKFLNDAVFSERNEFFLSKADVIINIDNLSEAQVVDKILLELNIFFKD